MKKNFYFFLTLLFPAAVFAQQTNTEQVPKLPDSTFFQANLARARRIGEALSENLEANNEQKGQIVRLNIEQQEKRNQALKISPNKGAFLEAVQLIESKRDSLYQNILTPVQYQKY
ncbi:MAG: hypothetical protein QM640_03185, partial [Niabella sp.]